MSQHALTTINGYVPPDGPSARLYNKLRDRLMTGEAHQQKLINEVAALVIRDRLVAPTQMRLHPADGSSKLVIRYQGQDPCTIHRHALNQLAAKVNVPMTYVNHLSSDSAENWKAELLGHILTQSFHKTEFYDRAGDPRFLHRIVGNELRGFLSRRFNRQIASAPLLRAFLGACQEIDAYPVDATATPVKLALRCFLPHVFEPVQGEYVCLGVEWSNSDFGAGRLQVALTMWAPSTDRFTVLDHTLSRVHIGSIIEDSDLELSEETASKEAETQALAIRDAVKKQLDVESVETVLKAVHVAATEAVPWHRIKGNLARYLGKKELESLKAALEQEILDLPPPIRVNGEIQPTKWWASSALSWLASKETDPDKKMELQHAAGSFIEVKKDA